MLMKTVENRLAVVTRLARRTCAVALAAAGLAFGSAHAQSSILLAKTAYQGNSGLAGCAGAGEIARGDIGLPVTYCFTIRNTGSTALDNVTLQDPQLGVTQGFGSLAPNGTASFFFQSTITNDTVNTATVTANANPGGAVVQDSDTARVDSLADCPSECFLVSDVANNGGPDRLYRFDIRTGISSFEGVIRPAGATSGTDANCLEAATFALPSLVTPVPLLYSLDAGTTCGNGPIGSTNLINQGFLGTIDYANPEVIAGVTNNVWRPLPNPVGAGSNINFNAGVLIPINDVDAMDFDPVGVPGFPAGTLFIAVRQDAGPDLLAVVDPATGRLVKNTYGPGQDFAVMPTFTVQETNQTTGAVTTRTIDDVDDFAISKLTTQMWGIANDDGSFDYLVEIDRTTGGFLRSFPIRDINGNRFQDMEGLSFDPIAGLLYGTSGSAGTPANSLFQISLTAGNEGEAVLLGTIAGTGDYEGSDCFLVEPDAISTISGVVYYDASENGVLDGVEQPLANALITLWIDLNSNGVLEVNNDFEFLSEISDANGQYTFLVPINQSYLIQITEAGLPQDYCTVTTRTTANIIVPAECGFNAVAPDFGVTTCRALGDFVWDDLNQDGIQQGNEPGLGGVSLNLLDSNGVLVTNRLTNLDGSYLFTNLHASNYVLEVLLPTPAYEYTVADAPGLDLLDSDINPLTGRTALIDLRGEPPPGQFVVTNNTVDAGLYLPNDVGVTKTSFAPVASNGDVTFSYQLTVTNAGDRAQTNVAVSDTLPAGLAYLSDNGGGSFDPQSRVWSATVATLPVGGSATILLQVSVTNATATAIANTACVAISLPDANPANNCSTNRLAAVGDFVWQDFDADGIQDASELAGGVPGATVRLLDEAGVQVGVTTTRADGSYFFGVPAGNYEVEFNAPAGTTITAQNAGGTEATDSDASVVSGRTGVFILNAGQVNRDVDAGVLVPVDIAKDVAGVLPGSAAVTFDYTITVSNRSSIVANPVVIDDPLPAWATYVSDDAGGTVAGGTYTANVGPLNPGASRSVNVRVTVLDSFLVSSLVNTAIVNQASVALHESAILGDRVFRDDNRDGLQTPGEPGVAGAVVQLFNAAGTVQLAQTNTNASGAYRFIVPPGGYQVRFATSTGTTFSPANAGPDGVDSDANPGSGFSGLVTLAAGDVNLTVDAGLMVNVDITKNTAAALPSAGAVTFDYVITVNNPSTLVADPVLVEDPLPVWSAYVSDDVGGAMNGSVFTANVGPLNPGASRTINLRVRVVDATLASSLVNTAIVNNAAFAVNAGALLGDRVFLDADRSSTQTAGDTGVANALVELLDGTGATVLGSTNTSATGAYAFIVPPGSYRVRFGPQPGTEFVPANVGDDTADSDAAPATGTTDPVSVANGDVILTVDGGVRDLLPGIVIEKTVASGAGQPCPGVESVTVLSGQNLTYCFVVTNTGEIHLAETLLTDADIAPVVSQDLGVLAPGQSVTVAVNSVSSTDLLNRGVVRGRPSTTGGVPLVGRPPVISTNTASVDVIGPAIDLRKTVYAGNNGVAGCEGVDFLTVTNGQIVTYCFLVTNTGDAPLSNVSVSDTNLVPNVTLNLGNLAPGQSVTGAVSRTATVDLLNVATASGTAPSVPPTVVRDTDPAEVDVVNPGILLNKTVYIGANGGAGCPGSESVSATNGTVVTYCFVIQNTGDAPLSNVSVTDNDVTPPFSAVVGGLPVGGRATAFVERVVNGGLVNIASTRGRPPVGPDVVDDDPATVVRIPVGVIGDFVWEDQDGDGVQDAGEPGLANVTVRLLNGTNSTVVGTTVTSGTGGYLFTNRLAGAYIVEVVPPVGGVFTRQDTPGSDLTDSDVSAAGLTAVFNLPGDVTDLSRDAGVYFPASVAGQVREDTDGDGDLADPDQPIPSVVVQIFSDTDCNGTADGAALASQVTNGSGQYLFSNLAPGCYVVRETNPTGFTSTGDSNPPNDDEIRVTLRSRDVSTGNDFIDVRPGAVGNFVWDDLNGNGLQDVGEPGIPAVNVSLRNGAGTIIETVASDASGLYAFRTVFPGTYTITYDPASVPAGFVPTPNVANPPNLNSDPDVATRISPPFTMVSGQVNLDQDVGFYRPITVGDFVWRDGDNDGIQDAGESGVPGVGVVLFNATTNAQVGAPTVTDAGGRYQFTGLVPGAYYVQFDLNTVPAGMRVATPNAGADNVDSDADTATGLTAPTAFLVSGTTDDTLDMGLVPLGTIGDTVWYDVNADGVPNENLGPHAQGPLTNPGLGIPGVTVRLYTVSGSNTTLFATTVTTTNATNRGFYEFTNLAPGLYRVEVDRTTIPAFLTLATAPRGVNYYDVDLTANPSVDTADFGFNTTPTAVELVSFTAAPDAGVVNVAWTTGSETDNLGFNVYRSARLNGERIKVNAALVEGMGSGAGTDYGLVDTAVPAGLWYYWLEDVEFGGTTTIHGPVRAIVKPLENREFVVEAAGLHQIAAGVSAPVLSVEIDGQSVPALASDDGVLIFNVPAGAGSVKLVRSQTPARMAVREAAPVGGETVVVISEDGAQAAFVSVEAVQSYLAIGFAGNDLIVIDETDPAAPVALSGVEVLQTSSDSGAYFSPGEAGGSTIRVQRKTDIPALR